MIIAFDLSFFCDERFTGINYLMLLLVTHEHFSSHLVIHGDCCSHVVMLVNVLFFVIHGDCCSHVVMLVNVLLFCYPW